MEFREYKTGCSVNLTALIVLATAFSTFASIGGGLVMYFESISALEDTISEVSDAECSVLRIEILKSIEETKAIVYKTKEFLYSPIIEAQGPVIPDATGLLNFTKKDTYDWTRLLRRYSFGTIRRSNYLYSLGVMLTPQNNNDSSTLYSNIWYDLKASGEREFVWGRAAKYFPDATDDKVLVTRADKIDEVHGEVQSFLYNWTAMNYYNKAPETESWGPPGISGTAFNEWPEGYAPKGWSKGQLGGAMERWREPRPWYASDDNPYVYNAYDVVFPPPPPPHPWSVYKYVWINGYFIFTSWEEAVAEYGRTHTDTEVYVVDSSTNFVYATSDNRSMIDKSCFSGERGVRPHIKECIVKISHMSNRVQEAWSSMIGQNNGFKVTDLDGEKYFVRKTELFGFIPSGGYNPDKPDPLDATILWIRPFSSVEDQVRKALYLLVVFSIAVLVVDTILAIIELLLVGLPLGKLADAMQSLEVMDLEETLAITQTACNKYMAVSQVKRVINGMIFAMFSLDQYKTFLPSNLFNDETEDNVESVEESVRTKSTKNTVSQSSESTTKCRASERKLPAATKLQTTAQRGALMAIRVIDRQADSTVFTGIIDFIQSVCYQSKATIHSIQTVNHTLLYLSWGLASRGIWASRSACDVAIKLKNAPTPMTSAIVHGTFRVGNVGNDSLRGVAVYGTETLALLRFEAFSAHCMTELGNNAPVTIIGQSLAHSLLGYFWATTLYRENSHSPDRMFELSKALSQSPEEWMYTLEKNQDQMVDVVMEAIEKSEGLAGVDRTKFTALQAVLFKDGNCLTTAWDYGGRLVC